jgi:transposase-like protein
VLRRILYGLSRSSISRRHIRATARQLAALQERRLERYDVVALVLDGKRFAADTMVIALGITLHGEKVLLGFVQTGTEHADVCARFLRLNEDAAKSLAEGLEETLTLHRLGVADRLGPSLSTTNGLESILALVEQRVGKVDRWTTSDQKQRWLATTLLELEPRLRRLRGYRALPQLRVALNQGITQAKEVMVA